MIKRVIEEIKEVRKIHSTLGIVAICCSLFFFATSSCPI